MEPVKDGMRHRERALYGKIAWRLIPILFFCYILAYLDRVNVGFAKLAMREEPWFSDAVFALGSGIFFIGYLLFEVPGNIILHRIGARIWIARIMVTWGVVSSLLAFSDSAARFYLLRFLLGVAEAGFFPGIILYLTYWFPSGHRARIVALFMTAVAFAGVFGSPLSGWLLSVSEGWAQGKPWQWLFILEGIPSVLMGLALPWLLSDGPEKASWLTEEERGLLLRNREADEAGRRGKGVEGAGVLDALRSGRVWLCCAIYFCFTIGLYGVSFWLPQIIESTVTADRLAVGFLAAIPWGCAAVGMVVFGRHSDRTGERRLHLTAAALFGTASFVAAGIPGMPVWAIMLSLSAGTTAVMALVSTFWSLPSAILSGTAAAAGIALVNSIGNLGGYISPVVFGWLKTHYHIGAGLMAVGGALALGGLLTFLRWK